LAVRTRSFAKVEADQETNDGGDHESESDKVKFTNVFSEALPLVRVKVEE